MNDQESKGEWDTKAKEGGRGQIARLLEGLVGGDEDWDFKHNWRMLSQAGYPGGEDASGEVNVHWWSLPCACVSLDSQVWSLGVCSVHSETLRCLTWKKDGLFMMVVVLAMSKRDKRPASCSLKLGPLHYSSG